MHETFPTPSPSRLRHATTGRGCVHYLFTTRNGQPVKAIKCGWLHGQSLLDRRTALDAVYKRCSLFLRLINADTQGVMVSLEWKKIELVSIIATFCRRTL